MKSATMAETMIRENKQNKSEMMMVVGFHAMERINGHVRTSSDMSVQCIGQRM
jgi:hypothetical protein